MDLWPRGKHIIWRSRPQGHIGYVIPFVVVEDTQDWIVLFQQQGSVCKRRSGPRGGPRGRMLLTEQWDGSHIDVEWKAPGVSRLHLRGSMISVMRGWEPVSQQYHGWYVNLESPWKRTHLGLDSEDMVLDVIVADDLSSWRWKDEDEFEFALASGRISQEVGRKVRTAGEHAADLAIRKEFPFVNRLWQKWAPDLTWDLATIPCGWNAVL